MERLDMDGACEGSTAQERGDRGHHAAAVGEGASYDLFREAEALLAARDPVAAVPLLQWAARQVPGEHAIERLLALALYGSSSFGEAERVLRALVMASPLDADVQHLLAQTLVALGRGEEARAPFALAGRLSPAYAVSCRTWGGDRGEHAETAASTRPRSSARPSPEPRPALPQQSGGPPSSD